VKVINEFQVENSKKDNEKKTIALLPGSRKQEISIKLPIMLQMASKFEHYHFVVAKAPGVDDEFYDSFLQDYNNVEAISGGTYAILNNAYAALVTSGTATLETALFNVPQVVCYKGNKLSYLIAKKLIKIKYISLVNLIMDKEIVKELIQDDFNPQQLEIQLSLILETKQRETIQHEYELLRNMLSLGGDASYNAASIILGDAKSGVRGKL
jgi:lipid-A-disaccharide synthase